MSIRDSDLQDRQAAVRLRTTYWYVTRSGTGDTW
jgi:hypothetical protein